MVRMFCTLKEAAERLSTTEAELEAMLDNGTLREFRDGANRLVKVADLTSLGHPAATGAQRAVSAGRQPRRRARSACAAPGSSVGRGRAMATRMPQTTIHYRPSGTRQDVRKPARPRQHAPSDDIKLPLSAAAPSRPRYASGPGRMARQAQQGPPPRHADRWTGAPGRAYQHDMHFDAEQDEAARVRYTVRDPIHEGYERCRSTPAMYCQSEIGEMSRPVFAARPLRPQTYEMSLRQWLWTGLLDDRPSTILILLAGIVLTLSSLATAAYVVVRAL